MDDKLKGYLQETVNMEYDQLVGFAQRAINELIDKLKEFITEDQAVKTALCVICCSAAADDEFTVKEQQFFRDALGADDAQALIAIKSAGNAEAKKLVLALSGMGADTKALVYMIVSAVAAIDGTINTDEITFLDEVYNA